MVVVVVWRQQCVQLVGRSSRAQNQGRGQGVQQREREGARETEWVARALEHYQGEREMVGPRRDGDEGGLIKTEVRAR